MDQTGFISGKYIGHNIHVRLLSDVMEFSDTKKFQGIFLFVDFEKAFSTLEWSFILKALEAFNLEIIFKNVFLFFTTMLKALSCMVDL